MVRKTRAGKEEEKAGGEEKAVVQEEKTQVIQKKPKKYVQKSVDALQRIERSKHERIFLINASRDSDERWNFLVQGVIIDSFRPKDPNTTWPFQLQSHANASTSK